MERINRTTNYLSVPRSLAFFEQTLLIIAFRVSNVIRAIKWVL